MLFGIAIFWRATHPLVIRYKNHLSQIHQVGLALKLYADDHQGVLPQRLEDMMPTYFTKREILDHVEYVSPGAELSELPPTAVLARRPFPEDHLVAEAHADQSAEARKP